MNGPYRLRPSAAHIWAKCSGYVPMSAMYPELPDQTDDTVREQGKACHWLAEMRGKGYTVEEGALAPNGVEIDEDMQEAVDIYMEELHSWGAPVYQEVFMAAPWIHPTECAGTPDAFAYRQNDHTLFVGDLKYGFTPVDPFENLQEIIYVSAVAEKLKIMDDGLKVVLVICQPRAFGLKPVRRWHTTLGELRHVLNDLYRAGQQALGDDPTCTPGPYCSDCSARWACPALQASALRAMDASTRAIPHDITPWAAGNALRRIKRHRELLEALESGLESQIQHYLATGQSVPFFQSGNGRTRTVWKDGVEPGLIALAKMMGHDVAKPQRAITPKQAEKLLDSSIIARFSEERKGRTKLVPIQDNTIRKRLQENG